MRGALLLTIGLATVCANAQVTLFNSPDPANNASVRASWLAAAGVAAPEVVEDFESYAIGTALSGVTLTGGLVITELDPSPLMSVQSSSAFFGSSVPFGQGLAVRENRALRFDFAAPVSYVGFYDIDQSGSDLRVFLADNTFIDFNNSDTTGSSGLSGEFLGVVSTGPAITGLLFAVQGGDGEAGIDSVEFGAVPEPATMIALAVGAAVVARRKRK